MLLLICWSNVAHAQPLTLQKNWWQPNGKVNAIAKHPTKDIVYLGGDFTSLNPPSHYQAVLDYNTTWPKINWPSTNGVVFAAIPDGKGGYIIGGYFNQVGDSVRKSIAHIDSNGQVTNLFRDIEIDGGVNSLAYFDNALYIGGTFTTVGGFARQSLACIYLSTNSVANWNPSPDGAVRALLISDGILFVAGEFTRILNTSRDNVASFNASTGVINSFNLLSTSSPANSLAVDENTLYIGCLTTLSAVNKVTGAKIWSTSIGYYNTTLAVYNDKLISAGYATASPKIYNFPYWVMFNKNNGTGLQWPNAWKGFTSSDPNRAYINNIVVNGDKLYVGGFFNSVNGVACNNLVALDTGNLQVSSDFKPALNNQVNVLHASAVGLYVGGGFSSIVGLQRIKLAAINSQTGFPIGWNASVDGSVNALSIQDSVLYVGGNFRYASGKPRTHIAALTDMGGDLTNFNTTIDGDEVTTLALNQQTIYAGGLFSQVNGQMRNNLASINTTTGALLPWNPDVNGKVNSILYKAQQVYVGGRFSMIGNTARNNLAAIDNSGMATTWNPNVNDSVNTLATDDTTLYVGGNFTKAYALSRNRLASYQIATGGITNWNGNADAKVCTIALQGNNVYVGGEFSKLADTLRSKVGILDKTTAQISSSNPSVYGGSVSTIVANDSFVFMGGTFSTVGYNQINKLAVYSNTTMQPFSDELSVATDTIRIGEYGDTVTLQVQSNSYWNGSTAAIWISLSPTSGTQNQSTQVKVPINPTKNMRVSWVTISTGLLSKKVCLIQDSNTTQLTFSKDTLWYGATGGAQTVTIQGSRSWSLSAADSWITSNTSADSGTKTIEITTSANNGKVRLSNVTFLSGGLSKNIVIVQASADSNFNWNTADTLRLSNDSSEQLVMVTSYQNWVASLSDSWININQTTGIGTSILRIKVKANTTQSTRTSPIAFAVGNTFKYLVIVQDGFVGLTENKRDEFKLYPNPSAGSFNIENPSAEKLTITVFDLLGKQYLQQTIDANSNQSINLNASPGMYLVKVVSNNYQQTIRLIIQ